MPLSDENKDCWRIVRQLAPKGAQIDKRVLFGHVRKVKAQHPVEWFLAHSRATARENNCR